MPACAVCGQDNPARARFCMSCATPLVRAPAPAGEVRKTVTVVFCDVVGSTPMGARLDPEAVRQVMGRFFEEMRAILERHGGTVEKYIGDAVMAVFGMPTVHEDDALRAVRAAVEMRASLGALNEELGPGVSIVTRTGVNTGEVVVGGAGDALVVGDPVNVAARLQQAASPGDILVGTDTRVLVRDAVTFDEAVTLALKGKDGSVTAYRVLEVGPKVIEPTERPHPPLVDRHGELRVMTDAFELVRDRRACHLLTTLGSPGIGKSRLADEFVASLPDEALVLFGRCLSYGEGITFWPVAEVVKQAAGIGPDAPRRRAREQLEALLGGAEDGGLVADRVAGVVGLAGTTAGMQETFWAIRRLFEWLARDRPLVVVLDDLQWAEPSLLDLIEYLVGWSRGVPLLLLVLARPDLLDVRPAWTAGSQGATTLALEPLSPEESDTLVAELLGRGSVDPEVLGRVRDAGGGNPLFVEELLRSLREQGALRREDDRWTVAGAPARAAVPPTIQGLLASRLDRLGPEEQTVIRSASVIGKVFWWGAVSELVPDDVRPRVGARLQELVRRELIRPEPSTFAGQDAFAFHHLLVQEAAYRGTPKGVRAELHERFAAWLEQVAGERVVEYEEILGFHLERAAAYRRELVLPGAEAVAIRAADRLAAAGRRALARGDVSAAVHLLERALAILPEGDPARASLLPDLGEALMELGDLTRADELLAEGERRAQVGGDRGLEAHARVVRLLLRESTDPHHRSDEALRELEAVIPVFEQLGDDLGLARAWRLLADVHMTRARYADADDALQRAIERARAAGARWEEAESLGQFAGSGLYGPEPVAEVIRRCEAILEAAGGNPTVEARAFRSLGGLRAMEGRFEEARELVRRSRATLEDVGLRLRAAFASETAGFVEMLAGDPAAAERELRAGYEVIEQVGEQGYLSTVAALLAHVVRAQGRPDEAEHLARTAERVGAEDDRTTQVLWRSAMAKVLVDRGRHSEAERLAREAAARAAETDDLNMHADALMDLGIVLAASGRHAEAGSAVKEAHDLYAAKGNLVSSAEADRRAEEIAGL